MIIYLSIMIILFFIILIYYTIVEIINVYKAQQIIKYYKNGIYNYYKKIYKVL